MQRLQILWRLAVIACCAVIIVMTLLLWSATGRAGFTKYHDAERAARDAKAAEGSLEDLFADTGIEPIETIENRFALGLAPSGTGKHLVSVATIAAPAGVIGLGAAVSLVALLRRPDGASENTPGNADS